MGIYQRRLEFGESGFGRAVNCPACNGLGSRSAYLAFSRDYAGIAPRLWNECRFATYDTARDYVVETHGAALMAAQNWTDPEAQAPPFLVLAGPYGIGKTFLAVAACRQLIEKGVHLVLFRKVARLLEDLRETQRRQLPPQPGEPPTPTLEQVRGRFETEPVLVLDDLGADRWTEFAEEQLTLLIDTRWENALRTLITTNTLPEELPGRIASRITDARLSRVIATNGTDQRLVGGTS